MPTAALDSGRNEFVDMGLAGLPDTPTAPFSLFSEKGLE
jgi:hypothetical protein